MDEYKGFYLFLILNQNLFSRNNKSKRRKLNKALCLYYCFLEINNN